MPLIYVVPILSMLALFGARAITPASGTCVVRVTDKMEALDVHCSPAPKRP